MVRAVFMLVCPISVAWINCRPIRRRERGRNRDGAPSLTAEHDAIRRLEANLRERDIWS
jgi:hypothetical protein